MSHANARHRVGMGTRKMGLAPKLIRFVTPGSRNVWMQRARQGNLRGVTTERRISWGNTAWMGLVFWETIRCTRVAAPETEIEAQ